MIKYKFDPIVFARNWSNYDNNTGRCSALATAHNLRGLRSSCVRGRSTQECTILDKWCAALGRDPTTIERSVNLNPADDAIYDQYVMAGAQHIILMIDSPWDLKPVEQLARCRDARR
jgi:hypothetical protein